MTYTISPRKYIALVSIVGLFVILALSALLSGPGGDMVDRADAESSGMQIENVASSKSTSKRVAGVCRDFGSTFACAPRNTPKGSVIMKLFEDGSAKYANGSKYSSSAGKFRA